MSKLEYVKEILKQRNRKPTYEQFMDCVEQMLVFHAVVNKKEFWWSESLSEKFNRSLRMLIKDIVFCFPRIDGDCHKYPKMHLLKHLTRNVEEYGAPINFDCMDGEKALQEFAKNLARTVKSVSDLSYFNKLLATRLEEHLTTNKMLKNLTSMNTPFLRIVHDMRQNRQNSSSTDGNGFQDSTRYEMELTEDKDEIPLQHDVLLTEITKLPLRPHWVMSFKVKYVTDYRSGLRMEHRDSYVYRLIQTDQMVFSRNDKSDSGQNVSVKRKIPLTCQKALERDIVQWLKDVATLDVWKKLLPSHSNQEEISIHGYFSCQIVRGGNRQLIRCDPQFLLRGSRYDFVSEEHVKDEIPRIDMKGILPDTSTPSKVLMLYKNPWDSELRAVTHSCKFNVDRYKKITPTFKISETYHLEMEQTSSLQNLLFNHKGEIIPLRSLSSQSFPPDVLNPVYQPRTNGTEVTRLGAPIFCVQQNPGLLEDANSILSDIQRSQERKEKEAELTKVFYIRDFREYWPCWFCE